MCDKLIKTNIPKNEQPEFVYKMVQKIGEGEYISPVMGEPMKMGVWKTAPKRSGEKYVLYNSPLVKILNRKFKLSRYSGSSWFKEHHNGKWGVFKYLKDAENTSLRTNFVDDKNSHYPIKIVKCKIGGQCHQTQFDGDETYLASSIKIVEEL